MDRAWRKVRMIGPGRAGLWAREAVDVAYARMIRPWARASSFAASSVPPVPCRAASVSPPCHWQAGGLGSCVAFGHLRGPRPARQTVRMWSRARATGGMASTASLRLRRRGGRAWGSDRSMERARGLSYRPVSARLLPIDRWIERRHSIAGRKRKRKRKRTAVHAHRRVGFRPPRRYFPIGFSRVTGKPIARSRIVFSSWILTVHAWPFQVWPPCNQIPYLLLVYGWWNLEWKAILSYQINWRMMKWILAVFFQKKIWMWLQYELRG